MISEVYSGPCQVSMMLLTISAKTPIIDVWQGCKYTSDDFRWYS